MRYFFAAMLCAVSFTCAAEEPTDLLDEIAKVDAKLFDAFNACDLKTMGELFSDDLEFYHDLGGLHGSKETMETTKGNCDKGLGLRRRIVEGSLKVYPIKDYGAIQIGAHTFCHLENGKDDCGTFEFVHIWRRVGGGWRLARVISYGH